MKKVIFLDIDGVLKTTSDTNFVYGFFEAEKLLLMIKLAKEVKAKIIIISSRRYYSDNRKKINEAFMDIIEDLDFISYDLTFKTRAREIIDYIHENNVSSYVIIDDQDAYIEFNDLHKKFIHVDSCVGFNLVNYFEAIDILNKED